MQEIFWCYVASLSEIRLFSLFVMHFVVTSKKKKIEKFDTKGIYKESKSRSETTKQEKKVFFSFWVADCQGHS